MSFFTKKEHPFFLKRILLFFISGLLVFGNFVTVFANPYPNHITNPNPYAVGIDVSMWNRKNGGKIDWNAVKNAGFSFVIIKISRRDPDSRIAELVDDKFEEFYAGAGAAGLKRGVYVFSYATDEADAEMEAEACLETLAGRPLELPVAFDIETDKNDNIKKLIKKGKKATSQTINAFCDTIEAGGYQSMIYTGAYFLNKYIDYNSIANRKLWIARYASLGKEASYQDYMNFTASTRPYYMWQFSSMAYVPSASYQSKLKDGKMVHHCDVNFIYDPAFADSGIERLRYSTLQGEEAFIEEEDLEEEDSQIIINTNNNTASSPEPTALYFNQTYFSLDANNMDTYKLDLTVFPAGASTKNIKYLSSDNEIATVDSNGILTPLKTGTVVITASYGFLNSTTTINITKDVVYPKSITLNEYDLLLTEGETKKLTAKINPDNAVATVQYSSSDTSVVTIDSEGNLKAIGEGEAVILVTAGSLSAECDITVEAKAVEEPKPEKKKPDEDKKKKKDEKKPVEDNKKKKDETTENKKNKNEKSEKKKDEKNKAPINIIKSSVKMGLGESYKFELELGKTIDPKDITWQSSDIKIVSGYDNGTMTAKAKGKVTLTAKLKSDPSVKDTVTVEVLDSPSSITFEKTSVTLKVNKTLRLNPILNKGSASAGIKFKSSDSKIVKVSRNGNLRAIKKGTAFITVTSHNKKTVKIKVTVK